MSTQAFFIADGTRRASTVTIAQHAVAVSGKTHNRRDNDVQALTSAISGAQARRNTGVWALPAIALRRWLLDMPYAHDGRAAQVPAPIAA